MSCSIEGRPTVRSTNSTVGGHFDCVDVFVPRKGNARSLACMGSLTLAKFVRRLRGLDWRWRWKCYRVSLWLRLSG